MATMVGVRRSQILLLVLGVILAAPAAFAADADAKGAAMTSVVRTGDTVAVTRWVGGKVKGEVVEATRCSLVLRAAGKRIAIPTAAIKTIRRHASRQQSPDPKAMLDVAANGDRSGYAPETVALIGVAALFKGIHDLGRKPEIVYRGTRDLSPAPACAEVAATPPRP